MRLVRLSNSLSLIRPQGRQEVTCFVMREPRQLVSLQTLGPLLGDIRGGIATAGAMQDQRPSLLHLRHRQRRRRFFFPAGAPEPGTTRRCAIASAWDANRPTSALACRPCPPRFF